MELNLWLIEKTFSEKTVMYWDISDTGMVWTDKPRRAWSPRELQQQIHQISINNELENVTFRQLIRRHDFDCLLNAHQILANNFAQAVEETKINKEKYDCLQDAISWLCHFVTGDSAIPVTADNIQQFVGKATSHDGLKNRVEELEKQLESVRALNRFIALQLYGDTDHPVHDQDVVDLKYDADEFMKLKEYWAGFKSAADVIAALDKVELK